MWVKFYGLGKQDAVQLQPEKIVLSKNITMSQEKLGGFNVTSVAGNKQCCKSWVCCPFHVLPWCR